MPRSSYVIAALLALGVIAWMASGMLWRDSRDTDRAAQVARQPNPTLVEVTASRATPVTSYLYLQGDVRPFRNVVVRAETAGRIAQILVREGQIVDKGQRLFELTLEARASRLREAEADIERVRRALEGAEELLAKGFTPRQRVDQLRAELAAAEAELARIREEIADTAIDSPFSGVVNNIAVEPGQFVTVGGELATLLDNDPLRVAVQVAQQDIGRIDRGVPAVVTFATGRSANGRVCFISSAAEPQTRTFLTEIRVANSQNSTPSGVSAEVRVAVGTTGAHFVSPAILSLDQKGVLGIKSVTGEGMVAFHPVELVRSGTDGVWVRGLPDEVQLITMGQGFVEAGDRVRVAAAGDGGGRSQSGTTAELPTATTKQAVGQSKVSTPAGEPPDDICATPIAAGEIARRDSVAEGNRATGRQP